MLVLKVKKDDEFVAIQHNDEILIIKIVDIFSGRARILFHGPESFKIEHSRYLEFDATSKTYKHKPRD